MRVIITGGSGLLGRAVTDQLALKGHEIVILSRSPENVTDLPANAHAVKWDAHSAEGWGQLVDGETAIINFAGASIGDGRWTAERKKRILESRLNAAKAVVEAIQAADEKPRVVIQPSGVGYYGNRGDELLLESATPGNDFLADVCKQWEAAVAPIQDHVRTVIIRTGVVLTTKGGALPKLLLPFNLFAGGPMGSGKQWFPWIHIEDQVAAILFLMENEQANGIFNLVSPEIVQNKGFAKVLGQVLSRPSFAPAPAFAIRTALGEMAALVLDGQRVVPQALLDAGYSFLYPHPIPAVRDIVYNSK